MKRSNSHYYDPYFNPNGEKFSLWNNAPGVCYFPSTPIERPIQYQFESQQNQQHIMLLTKNEAYTILDSWGAFGRTLLGI
ncbi:hypothetical protein [Xenorhabdus szentirmaii]|uniref:Uncharacterized protein n=2 Tax=Xenorhabdus szentirmaii TaxID=290112 RepID=W1J474_9GAMM|nr:MULTISPECIES: hypothetical protein [Xenorhabdus]MBD2782699.1 hypothetical protein [Xenorhabdus sp. 38]MBD2791103.1 hypothetical protein [Xenorhabdus sp. CUL]MBD2800564.1 hypothetical protein [Xenorhabdus sp. M]MBD2805078.1 hypothetical protein [Xenorhabdus sp. ZM]MBD2819190.1 hypothetical protein [Xenorhabdus sp. 42]